jgi:hypothetical protein
MAIFVLPPGAVIPTHSHPFMHVFSNVLTGELRVDEYDMIAPPRNRYTYDGIAVQYPASVSLAGDVRVLSPSAGNIHSFRANAWTAVFDLAVPPYSSSPSRACRYYARENLKVDSKENSSNHGKPDELRAYLRVSLWRNSYVFIGPAQYV